ncbi:hypothetical protein ACQP25_28435 [Microtetraspora malaysiensis]|uniref:hypothetical protein n=1 Tax=Microtetraspora malaysiensis TaxID=161358 RepID=UPI003D8C7127
MRALDQNGPGLYLLAYDVGSSVFGALAARPWQTGGWASVIAGCVALTLGAGLLVILARRFDTTPRTAPCQ